MSAATALYVMNPATDEVVFGDEVREGMRVMAEDADVRDFGNEDERLRRNRFCRVTRLRQHPRNPDAWQFIGVWVDGYQRAMAFGAASTWIVRRDDAPDIAPEDAAEVPGEVTRDA